MKIMEVTGLPLEHVIRKVEAEFGDAADMRIESRDNRVWVIVK